MNDPTKIIFEEIVIVKLTKISNFLGESLNFENRTQIKRELFTLKEDYADLKDFGLHSNIIKETSKKIIFYYLVLCRTSFQRKKLKKLSNYLEQIQIYLQPPTKDQNWMNDKDIVLLNLSFYGFKSVVFASNNYLSQCFLIYYTLVDIEKFCIQNSELKQIYATMILGFAYFTGLVREFIISNEAYERCFELLNGFYKYVAGINYLKILITQSKKELANNIKKKLLVDKNFPKTLLSELNKIQISDEITSYKSPKKLSKFLSPKINDSNARKDILFEIQEFKKDKTLNEQNSNSQLKETMKSNLLYSPSVNLSSENFKNIKVPTLTEKSMDFKESLRNSDYEINFQKERKSRNIKPSKNLKSTPYFFYNGHTINSRPTSLYKKKKNNSCGSMTIKNSNNFSISHNDNSEKGKLLAQINTITTESNLQSSARKNRDYSLNSRIKHSRNKSSPFFNNYTKSEPNHGMKKQDKILLNDMILEMSKQFNFHNINKRKTLIQKFCERKKIMVKTPTIKLNLEELKEISPGISIEENPYNHVNENFKTNKRDSIVIDFNSRPRVLEFIKRKQRKIKLIFQAKKNFEEKSKRKRRVKKLMNAYFEFDEKRMNNRDFRFPSCERELGKISNITQYGSNSYVLVQNKRQKRKFSNTKNQLQSPIKIRRSTLLKTVKLLRKNTTRTNILRKSKQIYNSKFIHLKLLLNLEGSHREFKMGIHSIDEENKIMSVFISNCNYFLEMKFENALPEVIIRTRTKWHYILHNLKKMIDFNPSRFTNNLPFEIYSVNFYYSNIQKQIHLSDYLIAGDIKNCAQVLFNELLFLKKRPFGRCLQISYMKGIFNSHKTKLEITNLSKSIRESKKNYFLGKCQTIFNPNIYKLSNEVKFYINGLIKLDPELLTIIHRNTKRIKELFVCKISKMDFPFSFDLDIVKILPRNKIKTLKLKKNFKISDSINLIKIKKLIINDFIMFGGKLSMKTKFLLLKLCKNFIKTIYSNSKNQFFKDFRENWQKITPLITSLHKKTYSKIYSDHSVNFSNYNLDEDSMINNIVFREMEKNREENLNFENGYVDCKLPKIYDLNAEEDAYEGIFENYIVDSPIRNEKFRFVHNFGEFYIKGENECDFSSSLLKISVYFPLERKIQYLRISSPTLIMKIFKAIKEKSKIAKYRLKSYLSIFSRNCIISPISKFSVLNSHNFFSLKIQLARNSNELEKYFESINYKFCKKIDRRRFEFLIKVYIVSHDYYIGVLEARAYKTRTKLYKILFSSLDNDERFNRRLIKKRSCYQKMQQIQQYRYFFKANDKISKISLTNSLKKDFFKFTDSLKFMLTDNGKNLFVDERYNQQKNIISAKKNIFLNLEDSLPNQKILEPILCEKRSIGTFYKKLGNEFAIISLSIHQILNYWIVKVYFPKTSRNFLAYLFPKDFLKIRYELLYTFLPKNFNIKSSKEYLNYKQFLKSLEYREKKFSLIFNFSHSSLSLGRNESNQEYATPNINDKSRLKDFINKKIRVISNFRSKKMKKVGFIRKILSLTKKMNELFCSCNLQKDKIYLGYLNFHEFYLWDILIRNIEFRTDENNKPLLVIHKMEKSLKEFLFYSTIRIDKSYSFFEIYIKSPFNNYREAFKSIEFTDSFQYEFTIRYFSLSNYNVQTEIMNLREIINLFIADGIFQYQKNSKAKVSLAHLKHFCGFLIHRVRSTGYAAILHESSTAKSIVNVSKAIEFLQIDESMKTLNKPDYSAILSTKPLQMIEISFPNLKFCIISIINCKNSYTINRVGKIKKFERSIFGLKHLVAKKCLKVAGARLHSFIKKKALMDWVSEFLFYE